MRVLAIHDGHNASACLVQEGYITHAVQEERFTGIKNQAGFPVESVRWIMKDAGLRGKDLDLVVFGGTSRTIPHTRESLVASYRDQDQRPPSLKFHVQMYRRQALQKLRVLDLAKRLVHSDRYRPLLEMMPSLSRRRISAKDHHLCHAASAYYTAPWAGEDCLVLTLDGSGDGLCATVSVAREGRLERLSATPAGHSLGDIYARVTSHMGFVPLEHEYKLMGLAPYADTDRAEEVCRIFQSYLTVEGLRFRRLVREPTPFIGRRLFQDLRYHQFHAIAGGLQLFTERILLRWIQNAMEVTGLRRLCLAGGVFMNVKANGLIAALEDVETVFVPPSCGDETLPFGAATLTHAEKAGFKDLKAALQRIYLGPDLESSQVYQEIELLEGVTIQRDGDLPGRVARLLAEGEIVARCNGPLEFGARALGNRSIFVDPSKPMAVRSLNLAIKMRDFWMPFAPVVLADRQDRYLHNPKGIPSPYMMFGFPTVPHRLPEIIGAVHPADLSARPQILERGTNPPVERLLEEFERLTGRSVLLNTSFNIHGEPMVASVSQALNTFRRSGLRWLWLGDVLLHKNGTS